MIFLFYFYCIVETHLVVVVYHRVNSITCINHSVIKHSTFISCRHQVLCVAFRETIFLAVFLSFCFFLSVSLIIWKPTRGTVRLSLLRISWNAWHHMARYLLPSWLTWIRQQHRCELHHCGAVPYCLKSNMWNSLPRHWPATLLALDIL